MVNNIVAKAIPIGCNNMLLIKNWLKVTESLILFLSISGDKFQVPWEEDSKNQCKYYMKMIADKEEAVSHQGIIEDVSDKSRKH